MNVTFKHAGKMRWMGQHTINRVRRLQSQLATKHPHIYSRTFTTHAYTPSSSALLCLFPSLHIHVVCVSITAWYHILFLLSDKNLCPSTSLLFLSLHTASAIHVFHLSTVSVNFVLCPIMSQSFMLKNDLCLSLSSGLRQLTMH